MKLQKSENILQSNGLKEYTYDIDKDNLGVVFGILRSKIYSDIIGSVVREISSNSRDAHIEIGNKNPIEIEICDGAFNTGSKTIIFRDFGPGISPNRMENIFVKYAASTKRRDNNQTGGFGLGAKSPFAYTDQFNIVTINNGIKYVYTAGLDESEKGKIILISENKINKKSGTEIHIPIKNDEDKQSFIKEIKKYIYFWSIKPKIMGFNFELSELDFNIEKENNKYSIISVNGYNPFESNSYSETPIISIIDGIPYKINIENIGVSVSNTYNNNYFISNNNKNYIICLKFKIGELSLTANRENLHYDENTKRKILNRLVYLHQKTYDNFQKDINKIKSNAKMFFFIKNSFKDSELKLDFEILSNLLKFDFNDKKLNSYVINSNAYSKVFKYLYKNKTMFSNSETNFDDIFNYFHIIKYEESGRAEKRNSVGYLRLLKQPVNDFNFDFTKTPLYYLNEEKINVRKTATILDATDERIMLTLTPRAIYDDEDKKINYKAKLNKVKKLLGSDVLIKDYEKVLKKKPEKTQKSKNKLLGRSEIIAYEKFGEKKRWLIFDNKNFIQNTYGNNSFGIKQNIIIYLDKTKMSGSFWNLHSSEENKIKMFKFIKLYLSINEISGEKVKVFIAKKYKKKYLEYLPGHITIEDYIKNNSFKTFGNKIIKLHTFNKFISLNSDIFKDIDYYNKNNNLDIIKNIIFMANKLFNKKIENKHLKEFLSLEKILNHKINSNVISYIEENNLYTKTSQNNIKVSCNVVNNVLELINKYILITTKVQNLCSSYLHDNFKTLFVNEEKEFFIHAEKYVKSTKINIKKIDT